MVYKISKYAKVYDTAKIIKARHNIVVEDLCMICDHSFIAARNFHMGIGSQVGIGALIAGGGDVTLKPYSTVGSGAKLIPATESPKAEYMCDSVEEGKGRKVIRGSITIGEKAYIGVGATICVSEKNPDIIIGDNTIIGAGVYIDKSIEADLMVIPQQSLTVKKREIWFKRDDP
jgi:acetyltransferase-like isoleucine patch superfamily enzyme